MKELPKQRGRSGRSCTEQSMLLSTPSPSRWRRFNVTHRRNTTLRQDIWTVLRFRSSLQHGYGLQLASYILELSVLILVLLNVVVAVSESSVIPDAKLASSSSPPQGNGWMDSFLLVSTIIFSIEYALRLWSCVEDERFSKGSIRGRMIWMMQPLSLIDLLALFPFYLELAVKFEYLRGSTHDHGGLTLRSLRLLRVVSFLRLERMYSAMKNLQVIFARKKEEFLVVSYLTAVVVLTSSLLIFFFEHVAQPTVFSNFSVCVWWSVETITSLGYGDIVPITSIGRVVAASLALWGVVLFTIPGAVLGSGFIEVMLEKQHEEEAELNHLAVDNVGSSKNNKPPSVECLSEGENALYGSQLDTEAAVHLSVSTNNPSTLHAVPSMRTEFLFQRIETITASQHRLETQAHQHQQLLERLIQLFETVPPSNGLSNASMRHN
ncbi:putative Ion transport domain, voltage-gated potassium channel [Plasmopara halstedii]